MDLLLIKIIFASLFVSLISFSGAILFVFNHKKVQRYMILFVALSAGSLIGTAFLHLIPEAVLSYLNTTLESGAQLGEDSLLPSTFILLGILFFYMIEKFVHWHHHHDVDCAKHSLSTLSLVGDAFHNFADGVLIGASFLVDVRVGIITTFAIALHEIPQEIGDLSILLHGGMNKVKALLWNFTSALFSVVGGIAGYLFLEGINNILPFIIAFTAGGFIYIALADIVPELHSKKYDLNRMIVTAVFLLGIVFVEVLNTLVHV